MGATIVTAGSWKLNARPNDFVLGLKELENETIPIPQKHIYFSHSYKNQKGAQKILKRFIAGKGQILDLEYLTDQNNKRVAAFGHWAGFIGASLGVSIWASKYYKKPYFNNQLPLKSWSSALDLIDENIETLNSIPISPCALIIGANGRCGRGAQLALEKLNIKTNLWGREETQSSTYLNQICNFDILVNCALLEKSSRPFINYSILKNNNILSVISDISCDPTGPNNPIAVYNQPTTLSDPVIELSDSKVSLTAIDHLPSLLPRESSEDFAEQLLPYLKELLLNKSLSDVWRRCLDKFYNTQNKRREKTLNI